MTPRGKAGRPGHSAGLFFVSGGSGEIKTTRALAASTRSVCGLPPCPMRTSGLPGCRVASGDFRVPGWPGNHPTFINHPTQIRMRRTSPPISRVKSESPDHPAETRMRRAFASGGFSPPTGAWVFPPGPPVGAHRKSARHPPLRPVTWSTPAPCRSVVAIFG